MPTCVCCLSEFSDRKSEAFCSKRCNDLWYKRKKRKFAAGVSRACLECGECIPLPRPCQRFHDECARLRRERSYRESHPLAPQANCDSCGKPLNKNRRLSTKRCNRCQSRERYKKKPAVARECSCCGESFATSRPHRTFCSKSCRLAAEYPQQLERRRAKTQEKLAFLASLPPLICEECGSEFTRPLRSGQKFCSKQCRTRCQERKHYRRRAGEERLGDLRFANIEEKLKAQKEKLAARREQRREQARLHNQGVWARLPQERRDELNAKRREAHASNPEKKRERDKEYRRRYHEKDVERKRKYRLEHPEKVREWAARCKAKKCFQQGETS